MGDIYRDKDRREIYIRKRYRERNIGGSKMGVEYDADKVKHNRKRFLNG